MLSLEELEKLTSDERGKVFLKLIAKNGNPLNFVAFKIWYSQGSKCDDCGYNHYGCQCEKCDDCGFNRCLCDLEITKLQYKTYSSDEKLKEINQKVSKAAIEFAKLKNIDI